MYTISSSLMLGEWEVRTSAKILSLVKNIHDIGGVDHFGVNKMPIASRQM